MDENSIAITEMLKDWGNGDELALENLIPQVESELKRIAHNFLRRENPNHTLQTSALVNEAYLKLINQRSVNWQNRAQFFALSAQIMRRILLNYARDRSVEKRGGGAIHLQIEEVDILSQDKNLELIVLDEALTRLAEFDPIKSRITELRFFGGLTVEETAETLQIAPITVIRHWNLAKAWLAREIRK